MDGRRIRAVVQVTKQSFAYVLDRVTGKPVWPIEERPVPQSTVPGEKTSATQPIPDQAAAIRSPGRHDRRPDRLHAGAARGGDRDRQAVRLRSGLHAAVGGRRRARQHERDHPAARIGGRRGLDWRGVRSRTPRMLYVPSMTNPFVANLLPGDPKQTNLRFRASTRALLMGPQGLPLMKPPYGRITALDLNRGDAAWMVANGDGPRDHPLLKALNLPPLGHASRGAPVVTRDVAVRARRRSGERANADRRRRQEVPRRRQGERRDGVGNRARRRRDRRRR